ncbi:MAG: competence protein ComEC [Mucilaginibacter sp.]|nr:competence protein ComEC [Mucilaginibacter sp.]
MIANQKGEIPFVILLLPFLLGITLGLNLLSNADSNWLLALFIITCIAFITLNLNYSRFRLYKTRWLGGMLITVILFLFGWISVIEYKEINNHDHFSRSTAQNFVVKINNEPNLKNGLLRFTADVEESISDKKRTGTLMITIKDSTAKNLYYGDELLIPAKYNLVEPPFTPAEFNYKQYLVNQNIFYQAFLYPKQYVLLASNKGNSVIAYSLRLRQRLIEKFKRNMHDTDAIAVASTLILGYKANLNNDILQAYSKTGTIHVLSVSGAHVAIIYILLTLVFGFLDKYQHGKVFKAVIIIAIIWYYSLLSGFSPAVCRAAVMISMVIIGKTYNRYINTLNILAISAFLLLVYDPLFITDIGFQLSYLAVFGLIVLQPVVYKWFKFKNKYADKLWALCSVSIAAQVITFPLSAFYFHQFPIYFLISNLFIIIPSAIIMYSGIFYLLLPQIPLLSKAIAFVLEETIIIMNKGLAAIEHAPYAGISKIWLTTTEYLLLYVIIICVFYFLHDKKSWLLKISLTCALLLCLSLSYKTISLSGTDSIAWLNLKKHEGIIFKHGNEAIVLSDLKQYDNTYQYAIQPYLDSCQINDIKLVAPDGDVKNQWFIKKHNFIQFLNKRVFIFSKNISNNPLPKKLKTDYIYYTDNPGAGLNSLTGNFDFHWLIISATNSESRIRGIKNQATRQHINYCILKRNNSIVSISN